MTQPVGFRTSVTNWRDDEPPDLPASFQPPSPLACSKDDAPPPPIPAALARAAPASPASGVRAGLDRFMESMRGPYTTPNGLQWVSPPFRMAWPYPVQITSIPAHAGLVERARVKAGLSPSDVQVIELGRGTPQQIRSLTQALIDLSTKPEGGDLWSAAAIRDLMFKCGIGMDCAGYTQQAYLSLRHQTRAQAGFATIVNESLSNLGQCGFSRIARLDLVRAGDIMVLGPPAPEEPGHRCIVYDNRPATQDDLQALSRMGADAQAFSTKAPVYVMQLDSSWGCDGLPMLGGVQRQTFFYSASTGEWGL